MSEREFFNQCIQEAIERDRASQYPRPDKNRAGGKYLIGDFYSAVFAIDNEADAARFYRGYVDSLSGRDDLSGPAESIARSNIGWVFGEGMAADRVAMWVRACGAAHPVFGPMTTSPTAVEAFRAGLEIGEADRA